MEKLREYIIKRGITDSYEIQKLEDFFNNYETQESLKDITGFRIKIGIFFLIFFSIMSIYFIGEITSLEYIEKIFEYIIGIPFLILGVSTIFFPRKTFNAIMSFPKRNPLKKERVNHIERILCGLSKETSAKLSNLNYQKRLKEVKYEKYFTSFLKHYDTI